MSKEDQSPDQILGFLSKQHRRSVSFNCPDPSHSEDHEGMTSYTNPSFVHEVGEVNFSFLYQFHRDDTSNRSRTTSQSAGSWGSHSLLLMSFASFVDVPTGSDDPGVKLRPRARMSRRVRVRVSRHPRMSRILGGKPVPDVFSRIAEEATRQKLHVVEKTFWTWDATYNVPAVIFIKQNIITKTVSKLVLCNDGFVETKLNTFFNTATAEKAASEAAAAGKRALGITDHMALNNISLLHPENLVEDLDLTFLLMEHSPNLINNRDEADHTVLWLAANAGKAAMVTLLLQYPAVSVNSCDAAGVTPLFAAARIGHLKIVQALLKKGARMEQTVTAKGIYGWTALTVAAVNGHIGVVKHLVNNGANPNVKDSLGRSVASLAKKKEHWGIVKMLKKAVVDHPTILRSIMKKSQEDDWNLILVVEGGLALKRVSPKQPQTPRTPRGPASRPTS